MWDKYICDDREKGQDEIGIGISSIRIDIGPASCCIADTNLPHKPIPPRSMKGESCVPNLSFIPVQMMVPY